MKRGTDSKFEAEANHKTLSWSKVWYWYTKFVFGWMPNLTPVRSSSNTTTMLLLPPLCLGIRPWKPGEFLGISNFFRIAIPCWSICQSIENWVISPINVKVTRWTPFVSQSLFYKICSTLFFLLYWSSFYGIDLKLFYILNLFNISMMLKNGLLNDFESMLLQKLNKALSKTT